MLPRERLLVALALAISGGGWVFSVLDVRYLLYGLVKHIANVGLLPSGRQRRRVALDLSLAAREERCRLFLGHEEVAYLSSVKTYDADLFLHLSNSKYFKEGDYARLGLVNRCGLWEASHILGIPIVVAASTIRHRKELPVFKAFRIQSRIVGYDRVSVFVEHRFVSESAKTRTNDLNALLFVRMHLSNKGAMRQVFEYLGVENMLPDTHPPPPDVAAWLEATAQANERVKRAHFSTSSSSARSEAATPAQGGRGDRRAKMLQSKL